MRAAGAALDAGAVDAFVHESLAQVRLEGRSMCLVVPDGTRTCPLPEVFASVHRAVHGRVNHLTVLVALGTHQPMSDTALAAHLGYDPGRLRDRFPGTAVVNHEWWRPTTFVSAGTLGADLTAAVSDGRVVTDVDVRVNRAVVEHDVTVLLGPVFPHEVVGFSGGNKYLFPGVSSRDFIDVSHWIGALTGSRHVIGRPGTSPVRKLVDEAAALVPGERHALCLVTGSQPGTLAAVSFGEPRAAWSDAADVSAEVHVTYLDAPVQRVLSLLPVRYPDLWTGAKGFYKVEPVVADGGEVVLHAPHIDQVSVSHPGIEKIGYHCRDFFLTHWPRHRHRPWAELAHSTHLRGEGTYDEVLGEVPRVRVTLATAIPEDVTRRIGLGYLSPDQVDLAAWRRDGAALVVPDAGEQLFRLAPATGERR